jgi:hypothetical protein
VNCQNCVTSKHAAKKGGVELRPTLLLEVLNLQNFDKLETNGDAAVVTVRAISFFCHHGCAKAALQCESI